MYKKPLKHVPVVESAVSTKAPPIKLTPLGDKADSIDELEGCMCEVVDILSTVKITKAPVSKNSALV